MIVLGIHGGVTLGQHDAGAAIMKDGKLEFFIEEERLTRIKGSYGILPIESISKCLNYLNISMKDIDLVVIPGETYKDIIPRTKRWIEHHFKVAPKIKSINHQLAHLYSSFYHSNFKKAACVSYDAYGDRLSGTIGIGDINYGIKILKKIPSNNSLGVFYTAMTSFLGFKPGEDEFKVMGLAPYGKKIIDLSFFLKPDIKSGFRLNNKYFREIKNSSQYEPGYSSYLIRKIGPSRKKGQKITQYYKDIAYSTQFYLEESAKSFLEYSKRVTNIENNLTLSGGVGLNCSLNGKIVNEKIFKNIFVSPSSSDRGLPLGCAYYGSFINKQKILPIRNLYFGQSFTKQSIKNDLNLLGVKFTEKKNLYKFVAKKLSENKIIAWFQGRSEFGPRALGNRSILANPKSKKMKDMINKRIKFREEFRPFAPVVISEFYKEIFDLEYESPYMTIACNVNKKWINKIPAVTHINNTARVQTVNKFQNHKLYKLINEFYKISKVPVLLNTSFNIRGQPIVETPKEAVSTFYGSGIDILIIEDFVIIK